MVGDEIGCVTRHVRFFGSLVTVTADDQIHRLACCGQLRSDGLATFVFTPVIPADVDEEDEGIRLGSDLIVVAQHSSYRILELQTIGEPFARDAGGLCSAQTDDAQLYARHLHHGPGCHPVGVIVGASEHDVGGQPGKVGLCHAGGQHVLPPVELVVADGRGFIVHRVVDVNGGLAVKEIGDGLALHGVAGVQQDHVFSSYLSFHLIHVASDVRHASSPFIVHCQVAVDVVRMEDGNTDRILC